MVFLSRFITARIGTSEPHKPGVNSPGNSTSDITTRYLPSMLTEGVDALSAGFVPQLDSFIITG